MKAGKLVEILRVYKLREQEDPDTGTRSRFWEEGPTIRAERVKAVYKQAVRGGETFLEADAVFLIRHAHNVVTGDRIADVRYGEMYDVIVEPNRLKDLKTLKCSLVND